MPPLLSPPPHPSLLPLFGSLACCWWGPVIHWAVRGGLAGAAAGLSGQVIKKTTGRGIHGQGWLVSCSRQQSLQHLLTLWAPIQPAHTNKLHVPALEHTWTPICLRLNTDYKSSPSKRNNIYCVHKRTHTHASQLDKGWRLTKDREAQSPWSWSTPTSLLPVFRSACRSLQLALIQTRLLLLLSRGVHGVSKGGGGPQIGEPATWIDKLW